MKKLLTIVVVSLLSTTVFAAQETSYMGYGVDKLIHNTSILLSSHGLLSKDERDKWATYDEEAQDQIASNMFPVFPMFDFERDFLNYCIDRHLITMKQGKDAITTSKNAGGVTVNNYNLLVFHACILEALVQNKYITIKEAQKSLNDSLEKK